MAVDPRRDPLVSAITSDIPPGNVSWSVGSESMAKMALRGLAASQPGCARIPMVARSKLLHFRGLDTLMQLSHLLILAVHLVPHGRAIHPGTSRHTALL